MNATRGRGGRKPAATMRGDKQQAAKYEEREQLGDVATDLPPKCICNLCNCGGHRCSDFSLWTNGGPSGRDEQCHPSSAQSMDGDNENLMEPIREHERDNGMSPVCIKCDEERYLTASVRKGRITTPGQQEEKEEGEDEEERQGEHQGYASCSPVTMNRRAEEDKRQVELEQDLLHVLVTRPEIASKPRDNILFEGEMDLRTTFETSYEALARMRLEHWKSHQTQRDQQLRASDSKLSLSRAEFKDTQHVSDQADTMNGKGGTASSEHQLVTVRHEKGALTGDVHQHGGELKSARMIRSPARLRGGDSLVGTGLALGQVQHRDQLLMQSQHREHARDLNSPLAATQQRGQGQPRQAQTQSREQSSPFVDPDLSPIIVYDANLNRLERVGLRKRSKYRPSTSLRPGGRAGFFGQSLDEEAARANGQSELDKKVVDVDEDQTQRKQAASPGGASDFCLHDGPAGDTSENLNRDRMAGGDKCGRKHNLSHVNRIDHIKQFNLVETADPNMKEFMDKATLTEGGVAWTEKQQRERLTDDDTTPQAAAAIAADERNLALAEEAAAVAEIQRVTSLGLDSRGNARTPQARVISAAPTPEAAATSTRQNANDYSTTTSPLATASDRAAASSRQARMQRVCQNQSFNIHENEYPEVKGGPLASCIKIGGRETVDLARVDSSAGQSRQSITSKYTASGRGSGSNLFRESPDFIMTTTGGRSRTADQQHSRQSGRVDEQQTLEGNVEEGALGAAERARTKSVSRNSNLHVEFDGQEDLGQPGRDSGASGGGCLKCRVLDLSHDFEFVGSRSGHKYFVERHMDEFEAPINELT